MTMTRSSDSDRRAPEGVRVIAHLLPAGADVPNNPRLPLLVYPRAVRLPAQDPASVFEALFSGNGWVGCWRNGIFPFHHYHSTAHEVLGIYSGSAVAQLGGEGGITLTLEPGDVVIIPAGVGHKRISSTGGLGVVGAYPRGQQPDMCRAGEASPARGAAQAARVPVPVQDPVHGAGGPMCERWAQ